MSDARTAYRHLTLERREAVAVLTLARPEAKNALNAALTGELLAALADIRRDQGARAVLLTGAGDVFCAGADLKERRDNPGRDGELRRPLRAFWHELAALPKPLVIAANGHAAGGGFELLLLADAVVMADSARLWLPEVQWGGIPGGWGTQLLPRLVGPLRARWIILNGHRIGAAEALALGLVTHVAAAAAVFDTALGIARELATRPPAAVAMAKEAVRQALAAPLATGVEIEDRLLQLAVAAPERRDALEAFARGRRPA